MSHRDHGSPTLSAALAVALILAAVLFPVFTARKSPGRIDSCLSNEKRLGLGLLQYAQDSDDALPDGAQGGGEGWGGQVFPYVRDVRTYQCEADGTSGADARPVISYALNSNAAENPALTGFTTPARTVLLFEDAHAVADVAAPDEGASAGAASFSAAGDGTDGTLLSGRGEARYATGLLGSRPAADFTQFDLPRHDGGSNFTLSDGHVAWLRPTDVSGGNGAVGRAAAQLGGTRGAAAGTANGAYRATFSVR